MFLSSPVGRLPSIVTFGCVRACTGAWRAGGVSAVLYWTAVPGHSALLSCMNRYLIHPSLISGPPRSAHFLPCHARCCCLRCCFTCILSCTSMTTVIRGQCQSSCRGVWGADSQKVHPKSQERIFALLNFNFFVVMISALYNVMSGSGICLVQLRHISPSLEQAVDSEPACLSFDCTSFFHLKCASHGSMFTQRAA